MTPIRLPRVPYSQPLAQHELPDLHEEPRHGRMKTLVGMLMAATLLLGSGCAKSDWIHRTLVTVDVTGTWVGVEGVSTNTSFDLEQQGSTVKGVIRATGTTQ